MFYLMPDYVTIYVGTTVGFQWYPSGLKNIHQEFYAKRNSNSSVVEVIFPWVHILYRNMLKWIHDEYFISQIFTDSMTTKNMREYLVKNDCWMSKFLEFTMKSGIVHRLKLILGKSGFNVKVSNHYQFIVEN